MKDHLRNTSRSRICIACRKSSVVLALALYGSKVFEILDCYDSNNIGSKLKSEFKEYTACTNKNIDIVMYRVFINYDFNNERHKLYNEIIKTCCKLLNDDNCFKQPILNLFVRDFLNGQLQNIDFVKNARNNSESGARKAHVFIFQKEFPTPNKNKEIYIKMQFPTEKRNSFGGVEDPKTHTININFDSNYLKFVSVHKDGISEY